MYKKIFFLVAILPLFINAQTPNYTSTIDHVTVFRAGAQIKRKTNIRLNSGMNEVVISNLPAGFDESSIQVSTKDKATINAVSYRNNFAKDFSLNPEYKSLLDQKEKLVMRRENETLVYDTWKEEESLLLSNKKVNGEQSGLNTTQLTALADVYRTRLLDVKTKLLENRRKLDLTNKEITKIDAQINEFTSKNSNVNTGEVVVTIISNGYKETILDVSYFDPRAGWNTSFDLRLESLQKPLSLTNKGRVVQYTGEDWKDVNLLLTTANPSVRAQAPQIQTWFLQYLQQIYALDNEYKKRVQAPAMEQTRSNMRVGINDESMVVDGVALSEARENITFSEYTLPNKMTIPSDSKEHEVVLKENEVDAFYKYLAIPKYDNKVYLMANVKDWEQYNFSSGEVKLYFEGTYVGTTFLNAGDASDTLTISLGPDIAINAKRDKLKDLSKTSFLSTKKQIKTGYEITLKNNKPSDIEITLKDQIPIATDAAMEIEAEELSGGSLNKETGIIEWVIKLKPGEQVKRKFVYSVKIPKDKKVTLN